jgi:hypothetical protein
MQSLSRERIKLLSSDGDEYSGQQFVPLLELKDKLPYHVQSTRHNILLLLPLPTPRY